MILLLDTRVSFTAVYFRALVESIGFQTICVHKFAIMATNVHPMYNGIPLLFCLSYPKNMKRRLQVR